MPSGLRPSWDSDTDTPIAGMRSSTGTERATARLAVPGEARMPAPGEAGALGPGPAGPGSPSFCPLRPSPRQVAATASKAAAATHHRRAELSAVPGRLNQPTQLPSGSPPWRLRSFPLAAVRRRRTAMPVAPAAPASAAPPTGISGKPPVLAAPPAPVCGAPEGMTSVGLGLGRGPAGLTWSGLATATACGSWSGSATETGCASSSGSATETG